jgi:hypothetical protein
MLPSKVKEPVEFDQESVDVEDSRKITDHFKEIHLKYTSNIEEKITTCSHMDLETLT